MKSLGTVLLRKMVSTNFMVRMEGRRRKKERKVEEGGYEVGRGEMRSNEI